MFNLEKGDSVGRLADAQFWSLHRLSAFREKRLAMIRQFCGYHYGENGAPDKVPVNYLELAKTIYSRLLAARQPQVLCITKHPGLQVMAADFEAVLNVELKRAKIHRTLQRCLDDAFWGLGIAHIDWVYDRDIQLGGENVPVGRPHLSRISLDDWVHDFRGNYLEDATYFGHKIRVPLEVARDVYHGDLQPTHRMSVDSMGDERAESITQGSSGYNSSEDSLEDAVELWQIYLKESRSVVVYSYDQQELGCLAAWDFEGKRCESGPYRFLYFDEVPDQSMPLAPGCVWFDLHLVANSLFRKLARQADRQKDNFLVKPGGDEDAERHRDATDGEYIKTVDPANIAAVSTPGPNQMNLAFLLQSGQIANRHMGNIDGLGGLGPQSETATQDRMLQQSATARLGAMQDKTYEFAQEICEAYAHWVYADPYREYKFVKKMPGVDLIQVPDVLTPEQRQNVEFGELNFQIAEYSLQPKSPEDRLAFVDRTVERLMTLSQMYPEQGMQVSLPELVRLFARYGDSPELLQVIQFGEIDLALRGPLGEMGGAPMPNNTTRTNVRVNRPGGTRQGQDAAMAQTLLGKPPQADQMASLVRPAG